MNNNIDLSSKSYKEIQALFVEMVGGSAVGKKRVDLEAAIEGGLLTLVQVDDIEVKDEDIVAQVSNVIGEKRGHAHTDAQGQFEFMSKSARIRFMFDAGEKQAVIAKTLGVAPQMVSNVVRAYKLKLAEEGQESEEVDEDTDSEE